MNNQVRLLFTKFSCILLISFIILLNTASAQNDLTTRTSSLFSGSGNCLSCHSASGDVMVADGVDVSPIPHWRSTMMANSARDPLWRAKVSTEVAEHPELQVLIESKCTSCHAPMGYTQTVQDGGEDYSIGEMVNDALALDGVSCTLCHQITSENFGEESSFNAGYIIEDNRRIYGPYQDPFVNVMRNMVNYTPQYAAFVHEAELCATCHTLFTPYLDNEGEIAGSFPEQTPYFEWLNSRYPEDGMTCQSCHMPVIQTAVDLATQPPWHNEMRSPFWKHFFVGGNVFMQKLLKDNAADLNLTSGAGQLDSTKARTERMLQQQTVTVDVEAQSLNDSTLVSVRIQNRAGHKIPTGIPIRRIWVHLTAWDFEEHIIFESGTWDEDGEIMDLDSLYEAHYDTIRGDAEVQIYEGVMQDVNGDPTFTLLEASGYLKDNRIPPTGFRTNAGGYEHIAIAGNAENDVDFNIAVGEQGAGSDRIHYLLPTAGRIEVEICYQTVTPRFVDHMLNIETEETGLFRGLNATADYEPVILGSASLELPNEARNPHEGLMPDELILNPPFPNPFNRGTGVAYTLKQDDFVDLRIMNIHGRTVTSLLNEWQTAGFHQLQWNSMDMHGDYVSSGVYFVILSNRNQSLARKIIALD